MSHNRWGRAVAGSKSQYSNWYADRRWRRRRDDQLRREPLCAFCQKQGFIRAADIADHIEPHRGDRQKFWNGKLQSLCAPCHSSTKQAMENGNGKQIKVIGLDGWPIE